MKRTIRNLGLAALAVLATASVALAQQAQQTQPDLYVTLTYIKVNPGMDDAYRTHVTTLSKKVYEEIMKTNSSLMSWSAARVMFPGKDGQGYDYVASALYAGPPPEPGASADAAIQAATGMTMADYQKKLAGMRTVVGSELIRGVARLTSPGAMKEGDIRVVAAQKIKPGMGDEFMSRARTLTQPVMQELITQGQIKGWAVWGKVFPNGNDTPYDALVSTTFKDLASAVQGIPATTTAAAFAKVHPTLNYATYINNGRDYSELQVRTVSQIVALVERPR